MVLLLACAMVATDFVRHPFAGAPPGSAAGARELTLWTAGTDAGAPPGQLARAAARALDAPGERTRTQAVDGGVAAAVTGLLDDAAGEGADLLVVHAGTFADLERERRDIGLPDVAARAERAERLLLRARPVALLAADPLLLAAPRRSPLPSAEAFAAALRDDADALVIGVDAGPWSRNALAATIGAVGARGRVRYRVLPSDDQAAFLDGGAVDAVVGPASMLRRGGLASRLRPLASSTGGPLPAGGRPSGRDVRDGDGRGGAAARGGGRATSPAGLPSLAEVAGARGRLAGLDRWVAVVAAPSLGRARADALTRRLRALTATARWRRTVARLGLGAPPQVDAGLLVEARRSARELTLLADRLDRGAPGR